MRLRQWSESARVLARPLVLTLAAPAVLLAQTARGTITGRITAAETGQPLQGASVVVVEATLGALSRADGTYRLSLPAGTYRLNARLIGYTTENRTVTVVAGREERLDLALKRAPQALTSVAVVGSRGRDERVVTTAPVPIDVITAEEIKQTGRTETAQILQML
ncbi:MAG: carboxypeptidase-like regulatory domain-containing protein, partial [Gemmatimonadaceae bacterium]|nr:carboxypeptidase-like regulatory domain-containing protein [Gemmatimonadaceae bacterium]